MLVFFLAVIEMQVVNSLCWFTTHCIVLFRIYEQTSSICGLVHWMVQHLHR